MNSPLRAAVILFPGSNREGDVARALRQASGAPPAIVWHADRALPAGNRPRRPARRFLLRRLSALRRDRGARAHHGRGARARRRAAAWSSASATAFRFCAKPVCCPAFSCATPGRRFVCKMQHLRVENAATPFTRGYAPRAGDQGRHRARRRQLHHRLPRGLAELERSGRVAFRYCDAAGALGGGANPNGSMNEIAGVYNDDLQRPRPDAASRKPHRSPGRRRSTGAACFAA